MAKANRAAYDEARASADDATRGLIERLEGMAEPARRAADAYRLVLPALEAMRQEIAHGGVVSRATIDDWARTQGLASAALVEWSRATAALSRMIDHHRESFEALGPHVLADLAAAKARGDA